MSRQVDLSLDRDQIEAATEEIITSGVLGEKSRLRELLRFVRDAAYEKGKARRQAMREPWRR